MEEIEQLQEENKILLQQLNSLTNLNSLNDNSFKQQHLLMLEKHTIALEQMAKALEKSI